MNATDLEFAEANFDLVFTKLVLWSVGNEWKKVLQEASRVMSPGGVFYALEPANDMIDLFPDKPLARKWMNAWDNAAQKQGLDPCIGKKLAHGLKQAGFEDVQSRFFPVIATGMEEERYKSIIKNLEGFYFGPAAMEFGLDMRLKAAAQAELNALSRESLVTDALFVSWAKKS
jgi:ubiquinone/menaquinone biosynthesis C-methylase UbiE